MTDDFDREVARVHRRRMLPSLLFSREAAAILFLIGLYWVAS